MKQLIRNLLLAFAALIVTLPSYAAYLSSTGTSGNSLAPSVAVPSGAAAGIIAVIAVDYDGSGGTIALPAGFTDCTGSPARITSEGQTVAAGWKRLSGADAGTYDATISGIAATDWVIEVVFLSGRHATNDPVCTVNEQDTGQVNPVTVNAADVTALAGDDMVWISGPDVSGSGIATGPGLHTPPTNYDERQDIELAWANLSIATRDNVSAGATGVTVGAFAINSGTAGYATFHVRVPLADAPSGNPLLRRRSN